jgi:hypothetical protein
MLGNTLPIPWKDLTDLDGLNEFHREIFDNKGKSIGTCKFTTKLNWFKIEPLTPSNTEMKNEV